MPKVRDDFPLLQVSQRYCKSLRRLVAVGEVRSIHAFCAENNINPDRLMEVYNHHTYGKVGRYRYVQIQDVCAIIRYGVSLEWLFLGRGDA